jgi:hypothetical protein
MGKSSVPLANPEASVTAAFNPRLKRRRSRGRRWRGVIRRYSPLTVLDVTPIPTVLCPVPCALKLHPFDLDRCMFSQIGAGRIRGSRRSQPHPCVRLDYQTRSSHSFREYRGAPGPLISASSGARARAAIPLMATTDDGRCNAGNVRAGAAHARKRPAGCRPRRPGWGSPPLRVHDVEDASCMSVGSFRLCGENGRTVS